MFQNFVRSSFLMFLLVGLLAPSRVLATVDVSSGFRGEYLNDLNELEKKYEMLEKAIPADKYGWAPADKVRSFGDVFTHTMQANNYFASLLSGKPMEKTPPPKATDKTAIAAGLKQSFATLRQAALATTDADLDKPVGKDVKTERAVMMHSLDHLHEHLGQLIAYARVNGITPPWSAMNMPA
jgi:uncharacterized damage-inducible protein DinB